MTDPVVELSMGLPSAAATPVSGAKRALLTRQIVVADWQSPKRIGAHFGPRSLLQSFEFRSIFVLPVFMAPLLARRKD